MQQELEQAYRPIASRLEEMERLLEDEMRSDEPFLQTFLRHFSTYRGKRVRPALLFLFGRALGGVEAGHVRVGAAAELLHVATLIHDDILDEASVRRKARTANRLWGNERSVLLGDWVFAKSFEIVARHGDLPVVARLIHTSREVCLGEMLQISHRHDFGMDEGRYMDLVRMKTGSLFGFCCEMGAFLSGSDAEKTDACRRYGENLGVAFQIIDDCLDITGKEEVVGKSLGTDVAKGKMTLPLIRALSVLPSGRRASLVEAFQEGDARRGVPAFIEEAEAVAYARDRARDFTESAKASLAALDGMSVRGEMEILADFVVDRAR